MARDGELQAHESTYAGFTSLLKWGTVISFITGLVVVFLIAN